MTRMNRARQNMQDAARDINRGAKKNAKVVPQARKEGPSSARQLVSRVAAGFNPASDLGRWSAILGEPFRYQDIFCPVSYNPAPSFIQSTARTSSTSNAFVIAANTCTQMALWPGHNKIVSGASSATFGGAPPMDAVAYHAEDQLINATTYVVGPMAKHDNLGTKEPVIGVVSPGLAVGYMSRTANAPTNIPMTYDVALPYVSEAGSPDAGRGHHSRWQLVAMGLRVRNITPEIYRGGNFVTVQPNNSFNLPTLELQDDLEVYPTYYDWGCPDKAEVSWIPRAQDLAFWHGADVTAAGSATAYIREPAILAFFNNGTANAQTYSFEVVCHWQLAGTYLNPVGGPSPHSPELKAPIEKVLSHLQNTTHTALNAPRVAAAAYGHNGATTSGSWYDTAMKLYNGTKKVAATVGAAL